MAPGLCPCTERDYIKNTLHYKKGSVKGPRQSPVQPQPWLWSQSYCANPSAMGGQTQAVPTALAWSPNVLTQVFCSAPHPR